MAEGLISDDSLRSSVDVLVGFVEIAGAPVIVEPLMPNRGGAAVRATGRVRSLSRSSSSSGGQRRRRWRAADARLLMERH
jgi:hypothetical protein